MLRSFAVAAILISVSATAQTPVIGLWAFDETSGLVAADFGPFGNNGTLNGYGTQTAWVPGQINGAITFDGVDDYVAVATNGGLPVYRGDGSAFSICFWVNGSPTDDDRVYSEGSTTNTQALFTLGTGRISNNTTDKLQLFIRNDINNLIASRYSTATVFDNTWHHVVYTDVSGDAKVYIDGVLDATSFDYRVNGNPGFPNWGTQTGNSGNFPLDLVSIGGVLRNNVVAHLQGSVDELQIYGFELSPADVQAVFAGGIAAVCRASIGEFGVGCGTGPLEIAGSGSAALGGPGIQLTLSAGTPGALAFLCAGFNRLNPLDLASVGFPGCIAYSQSIDCIGLGVLDGAGALTATPLMVPNTAALACTQANLQAAVFSTTLELSDVVIATLGN